MGICIPLSTPAGILISSVGVRDLREAAAVVRGREVHPSVRAMVVPGSSQVKRVAESEGRVLTRISGLMALLAAYPFKRQEDRERLGDALRKAGLPD